MHFYESSIITTKDGLHCQVYANEHPTHSILVKPKYIPTDKVESKALQYRFIGGKKMNRLNLWAENAELKNYFENFTKQYPHYVFKSPFHSGKRLFFSVPVDNIERVYFPRTGLKELMAMPQNSLDKHLKTVREFVMFLSGSGIEVKDLGVTYSTLMGHYLSDVSDINIVVYGKANYWKVMQFLEKAKHEHLRWKTADEWLDFYQKRNRYAIFEKESFIKCSMRKRSEGFFHGVLFVIFGVENEDEVPSRWGAEKYTELGFVKMNGIVTDNFNSVVRPGYYDVANSIVEGFPDVEVKKVVFHSRDYCMLASKGEKIEVSGVLEKVDFGNEQYYRIVVGYLDSYVDRRDKEFIRVVQAGGANDKN